MSQDKNGDSAKSEGEYQIQEKRPIIIVGRVNGKYENNSIVKEFQTKVLVSARPDGSVIVHDLNEGIRPLCYLVTENIKLSKNDDNNLVFTAITGDESPQKLTIVFDEVTTSQGISQGD